MKATVATRLLGRLKGLGTRKSYDRNQAIYVMGDPADSLYVVEAGSVKVGVVSKEGREKTLYLCEPGEFFGELCVCRLTQRPDQALALESSTVSSFSLGNLTGLFGRRPELLADFFHLICGRLLDCQDHAFSLAYDTVPRRLAKALLHLARSRPGRSRKGSVRLRVTPTHEELASLVGTSRGMVTTVMNEFRKRGLILYAPRVIAVHRERIRRYLKDGEIFFA